MHKSTEEPRFCIFVALNISPCCNKHDHPFRHDELFPLIKNIDNLTDQSIN